MHPPFSLFATQKTGRARSKEKPLGRLKSTLPRRFDRNTGVSAVGAVGIGNLYRVRFGLGEQGSYRPAFDGVGAAFGGGHRMASAPLSALPASLSAAPAGG